MKREESGEIEERRLKRNLREIGEKKIEEKL